MQALAQNSPLLATSFSIVYRLTLHQICSIRRLIETAAACGHSAALVEAINNRERERDDITRCLFAAQPDSVPNQVAKIRTFVTERLGDIRLLLNADVQKAKVELGRHAATIRMLPQGEGKKGHYIAEGEWNLLGGYAEEPGAAPINGVERQLATD